MWAFKLGKSSWQNVCVSVWERQEEEVRTLQGEEVVRTKVWRW